MHIITFIRSITSGVMRTETQAPARPRTTPAEVFALLEVFLSRSSLRLRRAAKPVVFEVVPRGERWILDPRTKKGPLLRPLGLDEFDPDVFRLSCSLDVLTRLMTDRPFTLREDDVAAFSGDMDDLLVVADALEEGGRALDLRVRRM
jgi:hypothetical protein